MTNEFKSFYKTVGGGEGDKCYYPTRLDPYGKGCYYNCAYCYAKSLLDFRKLWHPEDVGVADLRKIERTVFRKIESGSVVRLGGMTDCFQPIEKELKNTYKTIEMLNSKKVHYLIVTKSDLVATDEYMDMFDKKLAHIQISTPTNNEEILKKTDNAGTYQERKEAIETLFENGFDVSLRLAPFLFETCDFDEINSINVDKCLVEFLRVKPKMAELISDITDFDLYTLKEGGYRHLPLDAKIEQLEKLDFKELSVCDDVQDHYDYFQDNVNFNCNDCCNLSL